jgi:hypothetical protein
MLHQSELQSAIRLKGGSLLPLRNRAAYDFNVTTERAPAGGAVFEAAIGEELFGAGRA